MKKFYNSPELEITELVADDILATSNGLDNEIDIDPGDDFWN